KADLSDPRLNAEPELIVNALGSPPFDPVFVGGGPSQRLDLRMAVEDAIGDTVDPIPPVTDFAVGHVSQIRPERPAQCSEHLLDGVERDASDQQEFVAHFGLPRPHSLPLASAAPRASASSLAQAICGWTRPPRPQSVEAMTRSLPTRP